MQRLDQWFEEKSQVGVDGVSEVIAVEDIKQAIWDGLFIVGGNYEETDCQKELESLTAVARQFLQSPNSKACKDILEIAVSFNESRIP